MAIDEQVIQRLQGKPDWMQEGWEVKKQIEAWIDAAEAPLEDVEESAQKKWAVELDRKRQALEDDTQRKSLEVYRQEAESLRKRVAAVQAFEEGAVSTVLDNLWESLKTLAAATKLDQKREADEEKNSASRELEDSVAAFHRGKAMVQLGESAEEAFGVAFKNYNETPYSGTAKEKEAHKALQLRWYRMELQEARVAKLKALHDAATERSDEKAKLEYALQEAEHLQKDLMQAAENSQTLFPQHEFLIGGHLVEFCKAKGRNTNEVDQLMKNKEIQRSLAVLSEIKADPELIKEKIRPYQKEDGSVNLETSKEDVFFHFTALCKAIQEGVNTNFEAYLQEELGIQVVDESPDGNCLFRALARHLKGDPEKHAEVRAEICDYMQAHPQRFDSGEPIEVMRRTGTYGGWRELRAAEEYYGCRTQVYEMQGDGKDVVPQVAPNSGKYGLPEDLGDVPVIRISHHNGNHFNSLTAPDANAVERIVVNEESKRKISRYRAEQYLAAFERAQNPTAAAAQESRKSTQMSMRRPSLKSA